MKKGLLIWFLLFISCWITLAATGDINNWLPKELNDAYSFAYKNGITTSDSIGNADMKGELNRISMAKMLSKYALNILKKEPDTSKKYELQSDWNWNLKWCIKITTKDAICSDLHTLFYDNLEVSYDCSWKKMKVEKRPINECSNLGIHIQTTINK